MAQESRMNVNKRDQLQAIRLAKTVELPAQKDILDMSGEARRSKRRVELPIHPDGRPEPAVLAVQWDENSGKTSWMLYDGAGESASVVWGAADPDPARIVRAMRDWTMTARLAEEWGKKPAPEQTKAAPVEKAKETTTAPTRTGEGFPAAPGEAVPAGAQTAPTLATAGASAGYPDFFPDANAFPVMPYPPAPYPAPGYDPNQQPGTWIDPGMPPPHWAHSYGPPQHPLPPEFWTALPPQPPPAVEPVVGNGNENPMPTPIPIKPVLPPATGPLMLGDVLVAAGIIPTRTLQAALTLQTSSYMEKRKLGEILVSSGALPNEMLASAVKLQQMARAGKIPGGRMTEILTRIHSKGETLETILADKSLRTTTTSKKPRPSDELLERESRVTEEEQKKLKDVVAVLKLLELEGENGNARAEKLLALFEQSGVVAHESIERATTGTKTIAEAVKSLLIKEVVDALTFQAAFECVRLLEAERMQQHQAIIAIGFCQRSRVTCKEAIEEMAWDIDTNFDA
jgi:hypothetical protein